MSEVIPRKEYAEDEMLQLSGIQHYMFCPRQWALIHMEQQWAENRLTTEGQLLHANVDNPFVRETNGSRVLTLRGLRLASPTLGLTGIADAVELHPEPDAPTEKSQMIASRRFTALPIEYKRGRRKLSDCDRVQVAAQALILEDMLGVTIDRGAVFYWAERHREYFSIDYDMRRQVLTIADEMHNIMASQRVPRVRRHSGCKSCSLYDLCEPSLCGRSAAEYLKKMMQDEEIA
ncbi:MAG: CRISPR-associated protein Cas4 [Muribaculaceae bacterium]|nr:CRISPR-associated protein Cas4 [Muribaculaceae bacterium]